MKQFDFPQAGRSIRAKNYEEACKILSGKKPEKKIVEKTTKKIAEKKSVK